MTTGPGDGSRHRGDSDEQDGKRSTGERAQDGAEIRQAELIAFPGQRGQSGGLADHLAANRPLIIRRSLLASAVGGVVPIPVMDDYLAGRVRAGMLMRIADRRRVDLAPSSAELLADPREGTSARNATMTAATLVALKLAWRKFFILVGVGRRAEEMATTFQVGTLFDHFCATLHVGAGLDRATAARLRGAILASIQDSERAAVVTANARSLPALTNSIDEGMVENMTCTCPPSRSFIAGPEPR